MNLFKFSLKQEFSYENEFKCTNNSCTLVNRYMVVVVQVCNEIRNKLESAINVGTVDYFQLWSDDILN